MARFALRHWTAILIVIVAAGWAVFYLPDTPAYSIFQLKRAIDARDGENAATYVDFQKVVLNAGYEMVQERNSSGSGGSGDGGGTNDPSNLLGNLIGKGAVDLLSGPMAALLKQWAIQQVNDGAKEVQMPPAAVIGAIALLHRSNDTAYTRWQDRKGQVWEVQMARAPGGWKIVEVKNVKQLIDKLERHEEKGLDAPPPTGPS
jgi:hypothetical protein